MNKAILRKIYLEKRSRLETKELASMNENIRKNLFLHINFSKYEVIHTFLPIRKNNEINIWAIVAHLRKNFKNIKIIISQSDFSSLEMKHFVYKEDTILVENQYGIPEPHRGEQYNAIDFGLILIPLVAFDWAGHRVGYGKGFYDRFLANCLPDTLKVGLSLFEPVHEIDDVNENDVALDHCVTPNHFYSFKQD